MVIGYYVHHVGAGHRTRARVVSRALRERGHQVVPIGSDLGGQPGLHLPRDDEEHHAPWRDPDAGGALHWAPLGQNGFSTRMAQVARWVDKTCPDVVVVDVSVEVTLVMRLLGVPTVVVGQPGDRSDSAHQLGYQCATAIVAPWPRVATLCPGLDQFGSKVHHVGGVSSLHRRGERGTGGVVLSGRDGWEQPFVDDLRRHTPHMRWVEVGGKRWVEDVGTVLNTARVVVTHAGQNAIADVARCDVPTIVVAQSRPYAEQHFMASELDRLGLAVPVHRAVPSTRWDHLVCEAVARHSRWSTWQTEGSAARAAAAIEGVAHG